MSETMKIFWKNVERKCKEQGISLWELSDKMNYDRDWISYGISRNMDITLKDAVEIADILGVYLSELTGEECL